MCYKFDEKTLNLFFKDKYICILMLLFIKHGKEYLRAFRKHKIKSIEETSEITEDILKVFQRRAEEEMEKYSEFEFLLL